MGICNITKDSFSDGGKNYKKNDALKNIKLMLNKDLNIPDVINMCDYVEIIDKPDEITASKTINNSMIEDN